VKWKVRVRQNSGGDGDSDNRTISAGDLLIFSFPFFSFLLISSQLQLHHIVLSRLVASYHITHAIVFSTPRRRPRRRIKSSFSYLIAIVSDRQRQSHTCLPRLCFRLSDRRPSQSDTESHFSNFLKLSSRSSSITSIRISPSLRTVRPTTITAHTSHPLLTLCRDRPRLCQYLSHRSFRLSDRQ
jgi:hypothetical protein